MNKENIFQQSTSDEVNEQIERILKAKSMIADGKRALGQIRAEIRQGFEESCTTVCVNGRKLFDEQKFNALLANYEELARQSRNVEHKEEKFFRQIVKNKSGSRYEVEDAVKTYSEIRKMGLYYRQCVRSLHEMQDSYNLQDTHSAVSVDNGVPNFMPAHSYRDYVVGDANRLAYESLKNIAKYKTVCIWGESGSGKTHLVHAHGGFMLSSEKGYRICHIDCEDFAAAFDAWAGAQEDFIIQYCTFRCLIVEDVDVLAGKHGAQNALEVIARAYIEAEIPVIFSIKQYPDEIPGITPRLMECLRAGLVVLIERPDHLLKAEILARMTEADDIKLDQYVERQILSERNLHGLVNKYTEMRNLTKRLNHMVTIHDLRTLAIKERKSKQINMEGGN